MPTAPEKILARIARQRQQLLDDPDTAPAVARLFGFTGHADAIAPLVDLLYSPSLDAQVAAAEALLYLDRGQVKEALLEALQSRGPRSRMIHLLVVDMRPDADRLRALLLPWLSDRSELRRTATIQGLTLSNGANPDPRHFPRLVEMLRDPFPDVRQAAAVAVGAYLNAESLRALRPLVQDEDPDVKEQATIAVGWMALATKLPLAARQDAVDVLREVERGGGRAAEAARYWLSQAAAKGSVPSRR